MVRKMKDKKILIGTVGVDSGQLVICDPCYIKHDKTQTELNDYERLLRLRGYDDDAPPKDKVKALYCQLKYDLGHAGLGVVFNSGCGDGEYEVWATIGDVPGWGIRVKKVEVILI